MCHQIYIGVQRVLLRTNHRNTIYYGMIVHRMLKVYVGSYVGNFHYVGSDTKPYLEIFQYVGSNVEPDVEINFLK